MLLEKVLHSGNIPHALIFSGPARAGKEKAALQFAKSIVETKKDVHPDIHILRPQGKIGLFSIPTIRKFIQEVYLVPYVAKKKVFILLDADRMLPTSSNALLKTLEEPPKDTVIILITKTPERILPTIISRTQIVRFQGSNESAKNIEKTALENAVLDALSQGNLLSYLGTSAFVKEIVSLIEEQIKTHETKLAASYKKEYNDNLNAQISESVKNSVAGSAHMLKISLVSSLFDTVLSWYRDQHLIDVGGDFQYLFNPDYRDDLAKAHQRGDIIALETLQENIDRAKIQVERSTTLSICLDNFFLRLHQLR